MLGWLTKRKQLAPQHFYRPKNIPHQHYFTGLNYLINEQPDKAVDAFIKLLEVENDTAETHLALGNLFRRNGEVDRAIRIHQSLIDRDSLPEDMHKQALLELAKDYMRAGMLDHAETLFQTLIHDHTTMPIEPEKLEASLHYLLDIYQQQKDWHKALRTAGALSNIEPVGVQIAHYYCELALQSLETRAIEQARTYLRRALQKDKRCVRANLIRAKLEQKEKHYAKAIQCYHRIKAQDPDYITEVIQPLAACYEAIGNELALIDYLQSCLRLYPKVSIMLLLSKYLQKHEGGNAVMHFLVEQITAHPSLAGLKHLTELYSQYGNSANDRFKAMTELIDKLLANQPAYRCQQCGFSSKRLYWLCPSCKQWSMIKPLEA